DPGRPGPEDPQEVPPGRLYEPAHLLLPRRPVDEDVRSVRPPRHGRGRRRPRPVPELRAIPGLSCQLCAQHILRDLAGAAETYPDAHWPVQISQALQELIHAANTARAQGLPAIPGEVAAPLIHAFKHGVLLGLSQIPRVPGRKQEPCRDLLECLRDRQDDVLRFTTDLRIPPTSNQAERDLRPAKTQQKISGRLRSEQVTRDRYAIRGYISTVAKHGAHVLTPTPDPPPGNPWIPPIPDPP